MFKFCSNCNTNMGITKKFKLWNKKGIKGYTCEECKTNYKPTVVSVAIDFIIIWTTCMFMFLNEIHLEIGIVSSIIILLIVALATPSIVIKYKKKK